MIGRNIQSKSTTQQSITEGAVYVYVVDMSQPWTNLPIITPKNGLRLALRIAHNTPVMLHKSSSLSQGYKNIKILRTGMPHNLFKPSEAETSRVFDPFTRNSASGV